MDTDGSHQSFKLFFEKGIRPSKSLKSRRLRYERKCFEPANNPPQIKNRPARKIWRAGRISVLPKSNWLDHAMQPNAVAFGVLKDGDETVLTDRRSRFYYRAPGGGNAFQHAVQIPFHIEVNDRSTLAGRDAVHLCNRTTNSLLLFVWKHAHAAVLHFELFQGRLQRSFVKALCAAEVGYIEFEPI